MSHYLDSSLVGNNNIIALSLHIFFNCLILSLLPIILSLIEDRPISLGGNVLSNLDVFFSSLELFEFLLEVFNKILGECRLASGTVLAAPGSLGGSQIQMLHDFIFCDIVFVHLLVVLRITFILRLDFPAEFGFSLFLWNFETTGEAASFFIQKFRDLLLRGILRLVLHISSYFWHFALWIQRTHAQA